MSSKNTTKQNLLLFFYNIVSCCCIALKLLSNKSTLLVAREKLYKPSICHGLFTANLDGYAYQQQLDAVLLIVLSPMQIGVHCETAGSMPCFTTQHGLALLPRHVVRCR
jgi:hypothetical protein